MSDDIWIESFVSIPGETFYNATIPQRAGDVVISRVLSLKSFDVPSGQNIERTIDDVINEFLTQNKHANYLEANVIVGSMELRTPEGLKKVPKIETKYFEKFVKSVII